MQALVGAFGDEVKAAREAAGMTQRQLAAALEVRQQTVSGWESGVSSPPPKRARDLERVLKLPHGTFLKQLGFWEGEMDSSGPRRPEPTPAFMGKVDRLSDRDRRVIERMVDEMLGEE